MTIQSWIAGQTYQIKLLLGLATGIVVYGTFRFFIHLANKDWKSRKDNIKKPTQEEYLRNLAS